jgi:hypothetical protein
MKVVVHPDRLPISLIRNLTNEKGELTDPETRRVIDKQLREFLEF